MVDSESPLDKCFNDTDFFGTGFKFPPPPKIYPDVGESSGCEEDWDSSGEEAVGKRRPRRHRVKTAPSASPYQKTSTDELPPIGFFWDIENCQVPKGCSAMAVVAIIRDTFLPGRREAEFTVVCDARKEQPSLLQELNDAQVNLLHVCGIQKNAADEKLRQCMRRYAELHAGAPPSPRAPMAPPALLLISGDGNFASDLSDFRHRKKMEVILIHKTNSCKSLLTCVSHHHCFTSLTDGLPRANKAEEPTTYYVEVGGLPEGLSSTLLTRRLRQLTDNCGGRVAYLRPPGAFLRFQTHHQAHRALKRMDGEDIYGQKIKVLPPIRTYFNNTVRSSSDEGYQTGTGRPLSAPPIQPAPALPLMPPRPNFPPPQHQVNPQMMDSASNDESRSNNMMMQSDDNMGMTFRRPVNRTPNGYRSIKGSNGHHSATKNGQGERQSFCRQLVNVYPPGPSPNMSQNQLHSGTPSPSPSPTLMDLTAWNSAADEHSTSEHSDGRSGSPPGSPPYVDITVTNLEHFTNPLAVRNMLYRIFSEHVPVIEVTVRGTPEALTARVRVRDASTAQLAVSRLHRRRVAGRRMLLSLAAPPPSTPLPLLRRQVAGPPCCSAPDQQLPLFRLRELYATRHGRTLPASELARMRDTCLLVDSLRGRSVRLIRSPQPPTQETESWGEADCCVMHDSGTVDVSEEGVAGGVGILPVYVPKMEVFKQQLHAILATHKAVVFLNSLPKCFQAQFGYPLQVDASRGIPLEHLVSSIPGVQLRAMPPPRARKIIVMAPPGSVPAPSTDGYTSGGCSNEEEVHGSLAVMRALLAKELLDLLRTVPRCQMSFNRLIPSYHLHFGKQCRVADYGFTRLADLLDSLSHTVQVMGEGSGRVITLSHAAQIKRFTTDLLKVLRAQPDKSLMLRHLPRLYQNTLGREFDPVEYGACRAEDLMGGVSWFCVAQGPEEGRISLPRHHQTAEEAARIRHFASEAMELLRHAPNCRLEVSRFVPAYHTHFGRQLKVAHYGLPKVQDLFHAIPQTVEMWTNEDGERVVGLCKDAAQQVAAGQLFSLPLPQSFAALPHVYRSVHGHALLPTAYGCPDLLSLLKILPSVQLVEGQGEGGAMVYRADNYVPPAPSPPHGGAPHGQTPQRKSPGAQQKELLEGALTQSAAPMLIAYRVLAGDRCVSSGGTPLERFCQDFRALAGYDAPLQLLRQVDCIKVGYGGVVLTLLWRCLGRLASEQREQQMTAAALAEAYQRHYQHPLPCDRLGFSSVAGLLEFCSDVWEQQGWLVRVRPALLPLLSPACKQRLELLPSTPPGQKSSGVWCTPPAVAGGPWQPPAEAPAPPAPCMLPFPAPELLSNNSACKRRVRLAAQFDSPL